MVEPGQSVEDVKRAVDISEADVTGGVGGLHSAGLCELADDDITWRLTDAGRAYLDAGSDG